MWPPTCGRNSSGSGPIGKGTGKPSWQVKAPGGTGQGGVPESRGLVSAATLEHLGLAPEPPPSASTDPVRGTAVPSARHSRCEPSLPFCCQSTSLPPAGAAQLPTTSPRCPSGLSPGHCSLSGLLQQPLNMAVFLPPLSLGHPLCMLQVI